MPAVQSARTASAHRKAAGGVLTWIPGSCRTCTSAPPSFRLTVVTPCPGCGGAAPEQARFCPHCAAPMPSDSPTEERKIATILFADLVGSTELGASQDPERTRAMLGRFYAAMRTEIEAGGGTVGKFVGDGVMAALGTPIAHEDDAARGLRPGRALHSKLREPFAD